MKFSVASFAQCHPIVGVISVIDIPVVSVEVMYCEVTAFAVADLASVVISFHYRVDEHSILRYQVSVCLSDFIGYRVIVVNVVV